MNRKKMQRTLNKMIRRVNKAIADDELWLGRFAVMQKRARCTEFEDKSGMILDAELRFIDKKTNYYKDHFFHMVSGDIAWWYIKDIYYTMNKFITEETNTWREDERPSIKNVIDFRQTKVPDSVINGKRNLYLNYENFVKEGRTNEH